MKYPKILFVTLARVNAGDAANNGMFLRNLFADWPRENTAQIYSSGDNGDIGFFGNYYEIGANDRQLGSLFYKLKKGEKYHVEKNTSIINNIKIKTGILSRFRCKIKRILIDTGLYELIFRPKISNELKLWTENFQPDIILAQGYNLTFTWLPLLLRNITDSKIAFLTTDDWPTYLYSGRLGEPTLFRWLVRPVVKSATYRLLAAVDAPFAFGQAMTEEYKLRYGKKFLTFNHVDNQLRFDKAEPYRIHSPHIITIIAIGNFNRFRWPLLIDVSEACGVLQSQGINVRLLVLTSSIDPEGTSALALASYVDVLPDPGNDLLPSYLKGADILLLAEGFDQGFVSAIKLSVSSKAHLFMFSRRPIIVYSHFDTGVAQYANAYGWAKLVIRRNIKDLVDAFKKLIKDKKYTRLQLAKADKAVSKFHSHEANRAIILDGLTSIKYENEERMNG